MNFADILTRVRERTASTTDDAWTFTHDLLGRLGDGDVDESDNYAEDTLTFERFMVAGNGPTAWVVFEMNYGEPKDAYVDYVDSDGNALVPLPTNAIEPLYRALKGDTDA